MSNKNASELVNKKMVNNPSKPTLELTDNLVLFMDFLGFSEYAKESDPERTRLILDILVDLAARQGGYEEVFEVSNQGHKSGSAKPEITTFSDNIVASYPLLSPDGDDAKPEWRLFYLTNFAAYMANTVARMALKAGLLVRGGLTVGKLYHKDGVVYGPALVEAYELESRVAIYPRIAVSPCVYHNPVHGLPITVDTDGIRHLDYIDIMVALEGAPNNGKSPEEILGALTPLSQMIDEKIHQFEVSQQWAAYAKWSWMKDKFNAAVSRKSAAFLLKATT